MAQEIPSSGGQGNITSRLVLIPDHRNPTNATVAALQQQIITLVADPTQQMTSPTSTDPVGVGTIFQDMTQGINPSTFTQAITTLQQPLGQSVALPVMTSLTGDGDINLGSGESSEATFTAFEAISVLADASNHQATASHACGEVVQLEEKRVYSSVKANLSKSLVSAILRKSSSLESVLMNIATELDIQNILCELDEASGVYTLDGDVKELGKLQDVLIHYFDENLDINLENISPNKSSSLGRGGTETKDQGTTCNILSFPLTKSKSGRLLKSKPGHDAIDLFDENDEEYAADDDEEYMPNSRKKRQGWKRKKEPAKKICALDVLQIPEKVAIDTEGGNDTISCVPIDSFTGILGQADQNLDSGTSSLKFDVQETLLATTKLDTSLKQEMPAQSNEDVVSLLEKPLEGDDVRRYINMPSAVQDNPVEADFAKYVDMDANDLLGDGASDLVVNKLDQKPSIDLPPVTLSDEEAMAELERKEVEERLRVAREKVPTLSPPDDEIVEPKEERKTNPKTKKDYDALMPYKYYCTLCSFKSKRESHYTKHMRLHNENPRMPILKCTQCDFKTIRQCHLRRHEAEHSGDILECGQCAYKTTDSELLKKHTINKHTQSAKMTSKALLSHCPKCSYKTTRPYLFERHLRVHADILGMLTGNEVQSKGVNLVHSYQCPKCSYHTKKKEHFVRHLGDVHSEHRPYLCDTCGKSFKRADALKQHRDVHLDRKSRLLPYPCGICKKSFKSKAHLNDHKTIHTNIRAYLCEICGASFKTKSVQRKHILTIHRNPRAFHCPHCDKRFNTKFALERHSTTHIVPDGLIRTADVPLTEPEPELKIDGQQPAETRYIQVEVNPSSQLTTIQTIPIMQMEGAQVQDIIMKTDDALVEQSVDGSRIVPQIYTGPGEATTALLYLTSGNFSGAL